jgi:hypothetical protein
VFYHGFEKCGAGVSAASDEFRRLKLTSRVFLLGIPACGFAIASRLALSLFSFKPQASKPKKPASKSKKRAKKKHSTIPLPSVGDWRSTDEIEVLRRIHRAREEKHVISNFNPEHPVFFTFAVKSPSGMTYQVEVRDMATRSLSCTCPDFRAAGLGTCKQIEAALIRLKRLHKAGCKLAEIRASPHLHLVPDGERLRIERDYKRLPAPLRPLFDDDGYLNGDTDEALPKIRRSAKVRISQAVEPFLEARSLSEEFRSLRRDYETGVVAGRRSEHVTLHPLYPYRREGMLHLGFGERALPADEMGPGKTIQAVAACALLHHLGKAKRVLVVTPASLKTEWEEQIKRFTTLGLQLVFGPRRPVSKPTPPQRRRFSPS